MTSDERQKLRDAALAAVESSRAYSDERRTALVADWKLQTSNSFRRIGAHGDGDVLCATKHPRDGQPDLLTAPGVLDYIVAAQPRVVLALLDALALVEQEVQEVAQLRAVCEAAVKIRHWSDRGRAHEFGCGNDRPCDACDFETAIDAFVEASR